ncbi:MAG: membrane protein insertion efficiency factor YidD [Desulfobulbus propionicus]|nr:MAG: membrane protein insertion efficiency factor YidD [Desulfobulbus propionicus]
MNCCHRHGPVAGLLSRFLVMVLRGYKYCISPLLPPSCRFVPTCSEYAVEAVQKHGPLRGCFLALARLLRCHPFARGGYDPVK